MNIKYFIVISALISSVSYTMELPQPQKNTNQTDSIPPLLVLKNPAPQTIHITGFDTLIPFNGTVNPLFRRLGNRHKNKFGNTLVTALYLGDSEAVYEKKGRVRDLTQNDLIEIGKGRALYLTNMEKTDIKQKDGKFLSYGAIVLSTSECCFSTMTNKAEKARHISRASNAFQACYLANQSNK